MLKDDFKAEAYALGFSHAGVTTLQSPSHFSTYQRWLASGAHAEMGYMARQDSIEKRANPTLLLPAARSILCLAMDYDHPNMTEPVRAGCGRVAAYAWGKDYHLVIPPLMDQIVSNIKLSTPLTISHKGYSDTSPILERDLAQRAGLGWIGKNTCFIHPKGGSFFFLAEVLLDLALEPDPPFEPDRCGACRKCIDACPTGCIQSNRTIDARRCISYLTIEHKGIIPRELRLKMGNWVFGCDICQLVCPWNQKSKSQVLNVFKPEIIVNPNLQEELSLTSAQFDQKFSISPIRRAKRRGYLRNVAVAMGNQSDPGNLPTLAEVLNHDPDPLVRAHALWAVQQVHAPAARLLLDRVRSTEIDPIVLAELIS